MPVALTVPGSAVPVANDKDLVTLDVLGMVRDERNFPVGRFRETLKLPPGTEKTLAGKQVLYQSGVTLPPGRFSVKVVVRENTTGQMGSFEAPIVVPELKQAAMKVSSVVLSTQLQTVAAKGKTDNPLVRDGVQLLPNLTHVVGKDQKLFFYYEVYDPGQSERIDAAAAHEPRVLPRQGQGLRNAGRRTHGRRRARSARRALPVRGARRRPSRRASTPARSTSSTRYPASSTFRGCCLRFASSRFARASVS